MCSKQVREHFKQVEINQLTRTEINLTVSNAVLIHAAQCMSVLKVYAWCCVISLCMLDRSIYILSACTCNVHCVQRSLLYIYNTLIQKKVKLFAFVSLCVLYRYVHGGARYHILRGCTGYFDVHGC